MTRTEFDGTMTRTFDSLSEYVDSASGTRDNGPEACGRSSKSGDRSFTGTASFEEAAELAFGWKAGAAKIERVIARMGISPERVKSETVMREVGPGVLSMGNYVMGHPQPWVILQDSDEAMAGRGKVVRLIVNISASAGISTSVIERRGAAILTVAAAIEASGRRVQIEAVNAIRAGGGRWVCRVIVKRPDQSFSPFTLAFSLSHPSMLRRMMFAIQEQDGRRAGASGGYGSPSDMTDDEKGDALYFGSMTYGQYEFSSDESAANWVRETALSQGVVIQ